MDWQDFAALAVVAAATFYLLSGIFRKSKVSTPSCGSCGSCSKADEPKLVTLVPATASKEIHVRHFRK
jgi:hypothetical protein